MPDQKSLVINTGPIIALIAATENLNLLDELYDRVFITHEVKNELYYKGDNFFGVKEFKKASFLIQQNKELKLSPILKHSLDKGEASVIQFALNNNIPLICIDEAMGLRIARLNDLKVTGSLGILLKAKNKVLEISLRTAISNMQRRGIFLSDELIEKVIKMANE
ncbi:MAG: DUF3368 domain-containing protein [Bacteroidales bacterium]|nr:DUF3368 domain-containing protein [Candidatus Cloacimonadota bacterium]MBS3771497.1 DUF3368 domain-containing protein [Bacteroidales bacterium]